MKKKTKIKKPKKDIMYPISVEELQKELEIRKSYDVGDYLPVLLPSSFSF